MNTQLSAPAQQALNEFSACTSWEERSRLLLQWADYDKALINAERNDSNLVVGCASAVWLQGELIDGAWQFRIACTPNLLRGLLVLLLLRVNGLTHAELQQFDIGDWFAQLGLSRQLSPSRSNGLYRVLQRMQLLQNQ